MTRCWACRGRLWFWQRRGDGNMEQGVHYRCTAAFYAGYHTGYRQGADDRRPR